MKRRGNFSQENPALVTAPGAHRKPDTNPHRYPHQEGEWGSYCPGCRCHQVGRGPPEPPSAGSRAAGEESAGAGGSSRAPPLAPASHRPRALLAQAQSLGGGLQAGRGEGAFASPPRRGWGDGHTPGGEFRFSAGAGPGRAESALRPLRVSWVSAGRGGVSEGRGRGARRPPHCRSVYPEGQKARPRPLRLLLHQNLPVCCPSPCSPSDKGFPAHLLMASRDTPPIPSRLIAPSWDASVLRSRFRGMEGRLVRGRLGTFWDSLKHPAAGCLLCLWTWWRPALSYS